VVAGGVTLSTFASGRKAFGPPIGFADIGPVILLLLSSSSGAVAVTVDV
jgi:hypothetical protein